MFPVCSTRVASQLICNLVYGKPQTFCGCTNCQLPEVSSETLVNESQSFPTSTWLLHCSCDRILEVTPRKHLACVQGRNYNTRLRVPTLSDVQVLHNAHTLHLHDPLHHYMCMRWTLQLPCEHLTYTRDKHTHMQCDFRLGSFISEICKFTVSQGRAEHSD